MNRSTTIDFVKYRGLTALLSLTVLMAFAGLALHRYKTRGHVFTYSVDFTGGTQVLLKFDQDVSSQSVKEILAENGWEGATTRDFSGRDEVLIRVQEFSNDAKGLGDRMLNAVKKALPERQVEILQSEGVGPAVGDALRSKSVWAVVFALLALLFYIAVRFFSPSFAVGAVLALFHDSLILLAVFFFFNREISVNVIGAILAVLGYSINDTIVIFSQIRIDKKKMAGAPLKDVVNAGLNHTLRRTLLTSISTGLTVGSMFLLGGEGLRDLSLALLVGIVVGTYSSIFIASPVMMLLQRNK